MNFKGQHILSADQFSKEDLEKVLEFATKIEEGIRMNSEKTTKLLENKILGTLFYEPSTRTRLSFETAMNRLGGKVISCPDMKYSSSAKGETLSDTGATVSRYADVIAMRHPKEYSVEELSIGSTSPVINAGDGSHEHPTQALLDLYTIKKEKGGIDNIHIAMIGDLKYGRTVHSLVKLLLRYENVKYTFIAPEALQIPQYILDLVEENSNQVNIVNDLEGNISDCDVVYVTRIQQERFPNEEEYLEHKGCYVINSDLMSRARKDCIVLHPLPRVDEITVEFDNDSRAKYFDQAENGVYARMALISLCIGKEITDL